MKERNRIIFIIAVIIIGITLIGGLTYAWFKWRSSSSINFSVTIDNSSGLTITFDGEQIKLKGKIAEDIKSELDLEEINRRVWKRNATNFVKQVKESKKTEVQINNERIMAEIELNQMIEDVSKKEFEYREITEKDRNIIKDIQQQLLNMGLDLSYEEHKEMIMICGNFESITLNKYQLRELCWLIKNNIDVFSITPYFNEDEDKCIGIRIVIGINLIKEG